MKILLTGLSSFTGAWFARTCCEHGHEVLGTLRRSRTSYDGMRAQRIDMAVNAGASLLEGCAFGDDRFLAAIEPGLDAICHHAADVTDYQSLDFDVHAATAANTSRARQVMDRAAGAGVATFVATGSVFEQDEGLGSQPMHAFSPYGLAKGLSWQIMRYWAGRAGLPIGKFVIPNPFGPLEEARFCAYLMRTWVKGEAASIRTPAYVRDNIPVDLLARAYVHFVEQCASMRSDARLNPSGYVESQGRFAERFAAEIGGRLGLEARLDLTAQTEFPEPAMRINADRTSYGWDERAFWDSAASYYRQTYC